MHPTGQKVPQPCGYRQHLLGASSCLSCACFFSLCCPQSDSRASKPPRVPSRHTWIPTPMRTECLSARQHRCCNGNGALYSPINPTSFCAACSYVTLMLTRCAALRDGPGTPRHSNQLALYTALRLQPLLMSPRDKPPAIGSPAAAAPCPCSRACSPCTMPSACWGG